MNRDRVGRTRVGRTVWTWTCVDRASREGNAPNTGFSESRPVVARHFFALLRLACVNPTASQPSHSIPAVAFTAAQPDLSVDFLQSPRPCGPVCYVSVAQIPSPAKSVRTRQVPPAPTTQSRGFRSVNVTTDTAAAEPIVTVDRRRNDRRGAASQPLEVKLNQKNQRRRHIDPTTCERDYREDEIEFMRALDDYKRAAGRMFPTCSEVLEVIRSLGYVRLNDQQMELLGDTLLEEPEAFEEDAEEFDRD